jgi:DNA-binding transcriptional ArsR family regulator
LRRENRQLDKTLRPTILNPVVNYSQRLDTTFSALADPTRRAILAALCGGQASVTELAQPHSMSLPAVMKHLRVLEEAGLVSQEKVGRIRHCRLAVQPLQQASEWLSHYRIFWENQLNALDRYLTQSLSPRLESTQHPTQEVPQWRKRSRHRKSLSK